ncbi:MAG TPA: chemotaxis protein CheB [Candidatus Angelobacter sp.]|nr:chemotaxis protein CheB [Candidatus Angelobacter sp.]
MAERNIVVIGCSVGGVEALQTIVAGLPQDFPAAIFIVLHLAPQSHSVLPDILNRAGPLPAKHPVQGEQILRGHIYVAPPDHHLMIEDNHVVLSRGPKENRHRPSVDPLFRSAARAYGRQVIGIILTGALDDGTVGLQIVKKAGGIAIVQDLDDAVCADMPRSALDHVNVDHIVPVTQIPALLAELVPQPVAAGNGMGKTAQIRKEIRYAEADMAAIEDEARPGTPSQFACPDCGGVLWEMEDEGMLRFRCRVGHAYTAQSLDAQQSEAVEAALWAAIRALEESASLARQMAERAVQNKSHRIAKRFEDSARDKMEQAALLRNVVVEKKEISAD